MGDKTDCSNYRGIAVLPTTYVFSPIFTSEAYLHTWKKLLAIINVDFDVVDHLLIRYCAFVR